MSAGLQTINGPQFIPTGPTNRAVFMRLLVRIFSLSRIILGQSRLQGYWVFCQGVKRPGRVVNHPPHLLFRLKQAQLHRYTISGSSWPVTGQPLHIFYVYTLQQAGTTYFHAFKNSPQSSSHSKRNKRNR